MNQSLPSKQEVLNFTRKMQSFYGQLQGSTCNGQQAQAKKEKNSETLERATKS